MTLVLDASALLAALLDEPGRERVDAVISGAIMSTVNLAEVVGHFARLGADRSAIDLLLGGLPLTFVEPDTELAVEAGLMRSVGETAGLSLGDRFCLAQAKRSESVAVTADRAWQGVAAKLGVTVELIR